MTVLQYSLLDDPPVELSAEGKRVLTKIAPTTPAENVAAAKATTSSRPAQAPVRHPTSAIPLAPASELAVKRLVPLGPVVRIALLELLAAAAVREAQTQRAVLSAEVYPYAVRLDGALLGQSVQTILHSEVVAQAVVLNTLLAAVPDEPIPEESPEYKAYIANQAIRHVATVHEGTSTPSAPPSTHPADQFGMMGSALVWPTNELTPTKPAKPLKKGQTPALTPLVLLVGARQHAYQLPKLALARVLYATATQVRVVFFDDAHTERGITQDGCYCVQTPEQLIQLVARYATFQEALTRLADTLRNVGTYQQRLREACGITDPSTSLTATHLAKWSKVHDGQERLAETIIRAPDPTRQRSGLWWSDPFRLPDVSRSPIHRHTPLCWQERPDSAINAQGDTFPCANDEQWQAVQSLYDAVQQAQQDWLACLAACGTYAAAAADQRYAIQDERLPLIELDT